VTGTPGNDRIEVYRDADQIVIRSDGREIGRFVATAVEELVINAGAGHDTVRVSNDVTTPTLIAGVSGRNKLRGGGGPTTINGGVDAEVLVGGNGPNVLNGGGGADKVYRARPADLVNLTPEGRVLREADAPLPLGALGVPSVTLTSQEVEILLQRAAAASASTDGIIAIVDRNGRILGVRVGSGVDPAITSDPAKLVFAIDGAVAKARTGAFFGNNQAPLTSRTVQFISQSTITDREVNSNPNITDPNSTERGPGFVAPVGIKGHFPPDVERTPQVDLFGIEHTNRDGTFHVGPDGIKGTADDVRLPQRFNINPAHVPPGQELFPPDSFGFESGLLPGAQNRGIATLPGGVPIYKANAVVQPFGVEVVGGIGVFFPGKTGFATEENSSLSTTYDPTKPDRSLEAEWIAFAAVGGAIGALPVGEINGVPLPAQITGIPFGRIDLVGITLDIIGPMGIRTGPMIVQAVGQQVGVGHPNDGRNVPVSAGPDGIPNTADDIITRDGLVVPEGWLVLPHDGVGITAAEVERIITQGIEQAFRTRAAIRLPLSSRTRMVFAVADLEGNVVGLYRMADATVFSIDVAVAKARNVAYYADPLALQPEDQLPGVPAGTAFTNRTFRYLAHPRFPISFDGTPPAPFSQLNDAPFDAQAQTIGAPVPASQFQSVFGFDAFNPGTNFRDRNNILNQNGIVFFPGSAPLYRGNTLIGGFGVSGDGVDQDDVVTAAGTGGFMVPPGVPRADEIVFQGIRLPYIKFLRNPEG
jgi:uncharacterized protein GlcG (DUF336 family)